MLSFFKRKLKTFSHGIHPWEAKSFTQAQAIKRFTFARDLVILMSQHLGKPAIPVVREGQEVGRGQIIATADGHFSVPIHSPATGVIKKVGKSLDVNGKMVQTVFLSPYPGSSQRVQVSKPRDIDTLTPQEIVQAVKDIGMVGLGGAAFPTHVKFTPPQGVTIDTFILNGCECEPYLTSDHRVMLESPDDIIIGTQLVIRALGVKRAIIAIESNKADAIALLKEKCVGTSIEVQALETKYPQGAEKMLTRALLGRDIPAGGIPAQIGVVVSNIATVAEMGNLIPRGQGLIERVVTVSGRSVEKCGNYLIPIGTPLNFLLEQVGFKGEPREVIFGGPMMGKSVTYLDTPITKGVSGIVILSKDELDQRKKVFPCIKCAECVNVCPIHLNPSHLGILAQKKAFDVMQTNFNLMDCFECGCCSFVCPSNIPLVQLFRIAKGVLRDRSVKS